MTPLGKKKKNLPVTHLTSLLMQPSSSHPRNEPVPREHCREVWGWLPISGSRFLVLVLMYRAISCSTWQRIGSSVFSFFFLRGVTLVVNRPPPSQKKKNNQKMKTTAKKKKKCQKLVFVVLYKNLPHGLTGETFSMFHE